MSSMMSPSCSPSKSIKLPVNLCTNSISSLIASDGGGGEPSEVEPPEVEPPEVEPPEVEPPVELPIKPVSGSILTPPVEVPTVGSY